MAHRGNRYRLAFRRDFNLNVNSNHLGWAERYSLHVVSLNPFGGHPLDNTDWVLGPMYELSPNLLTWDSDVQHRGGRDWQWRFTDTITAAASVHDRHVQLFSPPGNLAAEWLLLHNVRTDNTFIYGSAASLVYRNPAVLSFDPIQSGTSGPVDYAHE